VRRKFKNASQARRWELRVINRIGANQSERWLNGKSNQSLRAPKKKKRKIDRPMQVSIEAGARAVREWEKMIGEFKRDKDTPRKLPNKRARSERYHKEKYHWEAYKSAILSKKRAQVKADDPAGEPETLTVEDLVTLLPT